MARILARTRDWIVFLAFIALSLLVIAKLDRRDQTVISGAFYVVDGDTLSIDGRRLRLAGIDAPELRQNCSQQNQQWNCGRDARTALAGLIGGSDATRCSGSGKDRYGRLLVDCQNGVLDINAEMVLRGMAVSYGRFSAEERAAKAVRIGIWAGSFERPQDWRRRQGLLQEDAGQESWREAVRGWLGL